MAKQTVAGPGLMAKYGKELDEAVQQHGGDDTNYGYVQLPGGIKQGVARLKSVKFAVYQSGPNEGHYYMRAEGTVLEPDEVETDQGVMRVAGLVTSIMEPVCKTETRDKKVTTQKEHIAKILNDFRMLGINTVGAKAANLEPFAAALDKRAKDPARPLYFRFSTSQGKATDEFPEPKVFENWHGTKGLEDYKPQPAKSRTVDNSAREAPSAAPQPNGQAAKPTARAKSRIPEPEPQEEEATFTDQDDLETLLERAINDDEQAQARLNEMAVATGMDEAEVAQIPSWEEVAEVIRGGDGSGSGDGSVSEPEAELEEEEPEAFMPKVKRVVHYHPWDPKKKKASPTLVECIVQSVDAVNQTCTLKNLDDGKTIYTKVAWDALSVPQQ